MRITAARQRLIERGKEVFQQAVRTQQAKTFDGMPGMEQLQGFIEQTRRRHVLQQVSQLMDGRRCAFRYFESEFGCKADGPQHAYRIFPVALDRFADEANHPSVQVGEPTDIIGQAEIRDIVIERIDGKIAAPYVLFDCAVYIVAENTAVLRVEIRVLRVITTEGGDLDHVPAVQNV